MKRMFLLGLVTLLIVVANPPGFTQTLGVWTSLSSLPSPRYACSAVLIDTTVYILGGSHFSSSVPYPVLRTGILPDGTLSGWVEESCRPLEIHADSVCFAHGRYLYAMSGSKGVTNSITSTMERALLYSNGSIGTWEIVGYTPIPFYESTWLQTSTDLYVFGGYPATQEVWRLPLCDNGSIGTWGLLSSNFNYGRYGTGVALVGNRIYIQGGEGYGNTEYTESAQILTDGNISSWQILTRASIRHVTPLLEKIGKRLYVISGCYPSWSDTETESAEILSDYTLGIWVGLSPYPNPRRFFAHVRTDKGLYVFGGRVNSDMSSVQYAPIIPAEPSDVKPKVWKEYN